MRLFTCHASTLKSSQLDLTASPTLMPSLILDSQYSTVQYSTVQYLDSQLMTQRTRPRGSVTTGLGPGQLSHTRPAGYSGAPCFTQAANTAF